MAATDGAPEKAFFDHFNQDPEKQATLEEVNRRLCEVLTELAEDLSSELEGANGAANGKSAAAAAAPAEGAAAGGQAEGGGEAAEGGAAAPSGVDEVAALQAYNDALSSVMEEKGVSSKDMCSLPDDHPLKELFFSAFDQGMFSDLMARFIKQVRERKGGVGEWDAEAAVGECDEDHTLE